MHGQMSTADKTKVTGAILWSDQDAMERDAPRASSPIGRTLLARKLLVQMSARDGFEQASSSPISVDVGQGSQVKRVMLKRKMLTRTLNAREDRSSSPIGRDLMRRKIERQYCRPYAPIFGVSSTYPYAPRLPNDPSGGDENEPVNWSDGLFATHVKPLAPFDLDSGFPRDIDSDLPLLSPMSSSSPRSLSPSAPSSPAQSEEQRVKRCRDHPSSPCASCKLAFIHIESA